MTTSSLWRTIGTATTIGCASTGWSTGAAWSAATRTPATHFAKLLQLLGRQDFPQTRINVFLQVLEFATLRLGQIELLLQERWQNLPGLWAAGPTRTSRPTATCSTGSWPRLSTGDTLRRRPTGTAWPPAGRPDGCSLLGEQRA